MRTFVLLSAALVLLFSGAGQDPAVASRFDLELFETGLPAKYRKQTVTYETSKEPGTIIINTRKKYLYFILGDGKALRYGVGVGRQGYAWRGTERVSRKAEWPGWTPPPEMRKREPHLPAYMPGGPNNPLGARALYLGATLYRIHGTAQPSSIGRNVSSGCIRLLNSDVIDLYDRVTVGAKVIVI